MRIKVTNDDEVIRSKVEERREVDGGAVDRQSRRRIDVEASVKREPSNIVPLEFPVIMK